MYYINRWLFLSNNVNKLKGYKFLWSILLEGKKTRTSKDQLKVDDGKAIEKSDQK